MPRVGFKPTITAFERAKTFHALDRAATVICKTLLHEEQITELEYQLYSPDWPRLTPPSSRILKFFFTSMLWITWTHSKECSGSTAEKIVETSFSAKFPDNES
jgi:hypothetical protein